MTRPADVDELIREALEAEDAAMLDRLGEPSLPDAVTEIFRGRMRWYGAMFLAMILVFFVFTVVCCVQFLAADDVPELVRWGVGFLFGFLTVLGGKTWYWNQVERVAVTREIKRVELLVAQLAVELRGRG
jgi:hypothetical protein